MPAEQRRAALIEATLPLIREHGLAVTTRKIAEAAGVAEGTIFGVFPDKQSLIQATILHALDPTPIENSLNDLDPALDLRTRFSAIATIVANRFAENSSIFIAMRRASKGHQHGPAQGGQHSAGEPPPHGFFTEMVRTRERLFAMVTTALEPHRAQLRLQPSAVSQVLLSTLAMNSHAGFGDSASLTPDEVVTLLLDGLIVRPAQPPMHSSTSTGDRSSC